MRKTLLQSRCYAITSYFCPTVKVVGTTAIGLQRCIENTAVVDDRAKKEDEVPVIAIKFEKGGSFYKRLTKIFMVVGRKTYLFFAFAQPTTIRGFCTKLVLCLINSDITRLLQSV